MTALNEWRALYYKKCQICEGNQQIVHGTVAMPIIKDEKPIRKDGKPQVMPFVPIVCMSLRIHDLRCAGNRPYAQPLPKGKEDA